MPDFSYADVPDQSGKVVVITGANQGLGLSLAKDFITRTRCAKLVLACRDVAKAQAAILDELQGDARAVALPLDLGDLASVRAFAEQLEKTVDKVDTLVLNAGCLNAADGKSVTKDGFETTIGVCHLGHFLLTKRLWPLLLKADGAGGARVVPVASVGHEWTKSGLDLADLNWERRKYDGFEAYFQAKLANVYFQRELTKRTQAQPGSPAAKVTAISLSPGYGRSGLYRTGAVSRFVRCLTPCIAQDCDKLSLNTMRAATDATLKPGEYLNPKRSKLWGPPVLSDVSKLAKDEAIAAELWRVSEEMVGEKFDV